MILANIFFILFFFLWGVRQIRAVLFWLYLWQLKEYHLGRFGAHLATSQGKRLLLSPLIAVKLALAGLTLWGFYGFHIPALIFSGVAVAVLYGIEGGKVLADVGRSRVLVPVGTLKMKALGFAVAAVFAGLLILPIPASPLILDLAVPVVVSALVLLFEAGAGVWRKRVMREAAQKRSRMKGLRAVAITGSYGKTSTKEFLSSMLETRFRVLKTPANRNSEMGIAACILGDLREDHEVFVAEMGAYGKGGIKMLLPMVLPSVGAVTGMNAQHLAVFGSMENLASAEGGRELAAGLPFDGTLVLNADSERLASFRPERPEKVVRCSAREKMGVWAEDTEAGKESLKLRLCDENGCTDLVEVPVAGRQYAENIAVAAACAREFGVELQESLRAASRVRLENGGLAMRRGVRGISVLDSSYSANPDGVLADLDHLKLWKGKRAVILLPLIELGSAAGEVHRSLGRSIAQSCSLALVWRGDRIKELREGAREEGMDEGALFAVRTPGEIRDALAAFSGPEDAVLLEGRVPNDVIKEVTA